MADDKDNLVQFPNNRGRKFNPVDPERINRIREALIRINKDLKSLKFEVKYGSKRNRIKD